MPRREQQQLTELGGRDRVADLLPAARAARDVLLRDDRPVTLDALAAWLRANGHPVGNARITLLLHALRSETLTPAPEARWWGQAARASNDKRHR